MSNIPFGLTRLPTHPEPDRDGPADHDVTRMSVPMEYSLRDQSILTDALRSLNECRLIVEIGMFRGRNHKAKDSSTSILLEYRPKGCVYIGIDKAPDKSPLNKRDNAYALIQDSSDIEHAIKEITKICQPKIDLLHIDGNHSLNQVLRDWQYVRYLTFGGVIVIHDTNVHPGPVALLDVIDHDMFDVRRYFEDRTDDWGIATCRLRAPTHDADTIAVI